MSAISTESELVFVDSEASLQPLLDNIAELAIDPPSLYLNLEGATVGRHGSISILSLYIAPDKTTYLIDIHKLGDAAFSTITTVGASLKTVLESSTIPKVVFDIRNISDALFSLFRVSIDGIKDLQLMELASRKGSQEFVCGLSECIKKYSPISATEKTESALVNERARQFFAPKKGGLVEGFDERPLESEIIQYCKHNVSLLPGLYDVYNTKLRGPGQAFWRVTVRESTKNRITLSQSSDYDRNSKNKTLGWDEYTVDQWRESWNDDIMTEHIVGTHVLNEDDNWVEAPKDNLEEIWERLQEEDDYEEPEDDWYQDTARDCIGWEEDMIMNGEYF